MTRIRLTDSETQADLVALATSCANADLLFNKQIAFVGMAAATTKANLIAAATALQGATTPTLVTSPASTRVVLVGPGVYDASGTLRGGSIAAAAVAAEVAKNADPSNDLDLWQIPILTGIEKDAAGLPLFRRKVVAGAAVNDFEDLLQAGVSPLQPSRVAGGVQRLVEFFDHLGLTLEHEHIRPSHGRHVQRLIARVQDEHLGHSSKNVATRSRFAEPSRMRA
jgi:hypothetical protein